MGWVDAARGIGIVLVVVGHALAGLRGAGLLPEAEPWLFLHRFVYAFHMPLFFFLAGLFVLGPARASTARFLDSKLRTVAWPYLVWSVLQTLVQAGTGGTNQAVGLAALPAILHRPIMQFWFLYALFLMLVLFALLVRAGAGPAAVLAVAAALYVVPSVGSLGPWGPAYSVASFMVYLAAGVSLGRVVHGWLAVVPQRLAGGLAAFGFGLVAAGTAAGLDGARATAPLLAACGIAASALLAKTLAGSAVLGEWGRLSLPIFVAHTLASAGVRMALARGLHLGWWPLHVAAGIAAGLLLPVRLARLVERAGVPGVFTWPARRRG
ncbi:MAG: acyltransferase family protein [Vicinamibacteria bacterium]